MLSYLLWLFRDQQIVVHNLNEANEWYEYGHPIKWMFVDERRHKRSVADFMNDDKVIGSEK